MGRTRSHQQPPLIPTLPDTHPQDNTSGTSVHQAMGVQQVSPRENAMVKNGGTVAPKHQGCPKSDLIADIIDILTAPSLVTTSISIRHFIQTNLHHLKYHLKWNSMDVLMINQSTTSIMQGQDGGPNIHPKNHLPTFPHCLLINNSSL